MGYSRTGAARRSLPLIAWHPESLNGDETSSIFDIRRDPPTLSEAFAACERPNRLVIESKRGLKGSNNLLSARQLSERGWINIGLYSGEVRDSLARRG